MNTSHIIVIAIHTHSSIYFDVQVYKNGKFYSDVKPVVCVNGTIYNSVDKSRRDSSFVTTFPSPSDGTNVSLVSINGADHAFIGRNIKGDSRPLNAAIKDFSIWFGELSADKVLSNFIVGVQPDTIVLTSFMTTSNIIVKFRSISRQRVQVAFLGGSVQSGVQNLSVAYEIFGKETMFKFKSLDPTCDYSFEKSLPIDVMVPAMNYMISLEFCPYLAPKYDSGGVCPPNVKKCFCAESLSPIDYMKQSGANEQALIINDVTSEPKKVIFEYHSGICFHVVGADDFSEVPGKLPANFEPSKPADKVSCYSPNVRYLDKGETKVNLTIRAFERYPVSSSHFGGLVSKDEAVFNYNVADVEVRITDRISNVDDLLFQYNPIDPVKHVINPVNIRPVFPFDMEFSVYVYRRLFNGWESTFSKYFIPVRGL